MNSQYLAIPLPLWLQQFFANMHADGVVRVYAPALGCKNLNKEQEELLRQQASVCFEHFYRIPSGSIFFSIRNTVLNYALELEKNNILGENLSFSNEEKEQAITHHTTINNINNFFASVENTGNISAKNSQI